MPFHVPRKLPQKMDQIRTSERPTFPTKPTCQEAPASDPRRYVPGCQRLCVVVVVDLDAYPEARPRQIVQDGFSSTGEC